MSTKFALRSLFLSSVLALVGGSGAVASDEGPSSAELIEALKGGGHIVFIRHAATETDYADQTDATIGDCSTQRTPSEGGWHGARAIGAAFAVHQIPVSQVFSREYCRAWQTADLAFGRYVKTSDPNFEPAEEYTEKQFKAMVERVRPHLATVPATGFNLVLVGHDDPFEPASGTYPEPMGIAFVVRPDGDGAFKAVGSIDPEAWF